MGSPAHQRGGSRLSQEPPAKVIEMGMQSTWSQRDLGNIFAFPVKGSFENRKGKQ